MNKCSQCSFLWKTYKNQALWFQQRDQSLDSVAGMFPEIGNERGNITHNTLAGFAYKFDSHWSILDRLRISLDHLGHFLQGCRSLEGKSRNISFQDIHCY